MVLNTIVVEDLAKESPDGNITLDGQKHPIKQGSFPSFISRLKKNNA